jgi:prepilin-type N-terminal cleavage/methylation domain-containing protein
MTFYRSSHLLHRAGYTLIEVLATASILTVGATAAVSLAASSMLQEELAFRVAVTRNHQENMLRLWQLGLSRQQVFALMPDQDQNALLQTQIFGTTSGGTGPSFIENGTSVTSGVSMESASCTAVVNIAQSPPAEIAGASLTLTAYRPRLLTSIRTPAP